MKKKLSLLMALVLSFTAFTACGSNNDKEADTSTDTKVEEKAKDDKEEEGKEETGKTDGQTEIVFWHAMGGGQGEALENLTKKFEEENPDIKVTLQGQGKYGDLNQILVASMQSPKDLPTITQAYPDWMIQFKGADMVADLTDYVKNDMDDYDDILLS